MDKKISDIKDLSITECLVDNCINDLGGDFWNNFSELNVDDVRSNGYSVYYNSRYPDKRSLPDPDACSERLYEFHGVLWEKQRKQTEFLNLNIPQIVICQKSIWFKLNSKNIILGSDSFISIYWHWQDMQFLSKEIAEYVQNNENIMINEIKKMEGEIDNARYNECFYNTTWDDINDYRNKLKKFIWLYLQKSNTIGGFIVFPRVNNSINTRRGNYRGIIKDRFDLTLECIRRAYQYGDFHKNDFNPLFGISEEEKEFFRMFGSFENYIRFFCLDAWVNKDYTAVNDLLSEDGKELLPTEGWIATDNILPKTDKQWWTFYRNIMNRLDARNRQIKEIIEKSL